MQLIEHHKIQYKKEELSHVLQYLDCNKPQLVDSFYAESRKIPYLQNVILWIERTALQLKSASAAQ